MIIARRILIRAIVFFTSLFIVLTFTEFSLRLLGVVIQTGREASFETGKINRDDTLRLRKELKSEKWILALGDSLTNGSNVSVNETYPFQLFHRPENKISDNKVKFNILNHGICESTTYQSLKQLREILINWNEKPDIIIYLGGASDLFSPVEIEEQSEINHLVNEIRSHRPSFIRSLRLYKIYRGIKFGLKEKISMMNNPDYNDEELKRDFPIIAKASDLYRSGEIVKADELILSLGSKVRPSHLESILNSYVDQLFFENDRDRVVKETLGFLGRYPVMFKRYAKYPLHRLMMAFDFQSEVTANEVYEGLKEIGQNNKWVEATSLYKKYTNLFIYREKSIAKINEYRLSNLRQLAQICKSNGIRLILQNYPANFADANSALERIAAEFNLPIVDNNTVFNKRIKAGNLDLFREDEHPSAEGYKLMSENVWRVLETEL